MKTHKCACFVWTKKNKKETCHLLALLPEQQKIVLALIQQLHKGRIKAFPQEYGLEYKEPGER
jgi:hypothetical protein